MAVVLGSPLSDCVHQDFAVGQPGLCYARKILSQNTKTPGAGGLFPDLHNIEPALAVHPLPHDLFVTLNPALHKMAQRAGTNLCGIAWGASALVLGLVQSTAVPAKGARPVRGANSHEARQSTGPIIRLFLVAGKNRPLSALVSLRKWCARKHRTPSERL